MIIALVLAAVAAVVFLALWLRTRREANAEAARVADLRTEQTALRSELHELRDVNERQAAEITGANAAALEVKSQVSELTASIEAERAEAHDALTAAESSIAEARDALEAATVRADDLEARNAALVDDRDQLQARLDDVSGALSKASERPDVKLGEAAATGTVTPSALWELELGRAERRWRHSVAPNPESDDSPFDEPGVDTARLAVEIEAAALREEVGAFITVDWKAGPIEDPAKAHLVVRMAQEILANAAREPEATHLVVDDEGDGDLSMRLVPADEQSEVINLIAPPKVSSDAVVVDHGTTLDVRVKGG